MANEVLALRYESAPLTDLTYNDSATNQMKFKTISFFPAKIKKRKETGELLNGRMYSHQFNTRRIWNAIISSNELDDNAITFLQNFWKSNNKFLSLLIIGSDPQAGTDYIEVIIDDEEFPISYIEDIEFLPELTLSLIQEKQDV